MKNKHCNTSACLVAIYHDHTYLGPTPKIRYVPDKDLTFPASNPLFLDKDLSSRIRYFPDKDIRELLRA